MSNRAYKVTKMGELPGDIPRQQKIQMLENPQTPCGKSYKKDHVKKANRRFRHNKNYLKDS